MLNDPEERYNRVISNDKFCQETGCFTAVFPAERQDQRLPSKSVLPTLDDINLITAGMTYDEITEKIGLPQESMTSGLLSADYYLNNDQIARIYYYYNNSGTLISSRIKLLGE